MGKENVAKDKNTQLENSQSSCKKKQKASLNRFCFRRNTEDAFKKPQRTLKDMKVPFREISNLIQNLQPHQKVSYKDLDPVKEMLSDHCNKRIDAKVKSELTSNESTPRIEEEEIVINTLGGYNGNFKKSFQGKNMLSNVSSVRL